MTVNTYARGDTVKLGATFVNWATPPVPTDPSAVTLKVYAIGDLNTAILSKTLADLTKTGTGVYYYDDVTSSATPGVYVYEYIGLVDGEPSAATKTFAVVIPQQ